MSDRPIGYYVHHHGAGHRARPHAIAAAAARPIVLLGTGIGSSGIDLPKCGTALIAPDRPDADCWTGLINAARALPAEPRRNIHDPNEAHAAAQWICAVAGPNDAIRDRAA